MGQVTSPLWASVSPSVNEGIGPSQSFSNPKTHLIYKTGAPLHGSLSTCHPAMLLMEPLGDKTSLQITPKPLVDSKAGAFLFGGRGSQGSGRVTGGNVIWIPGMYLETRRSSANICFSFDVLLEWPLVLPTCPSLWTIPSSP